MSNQLSKVFQQARSLVDDPKGQFATDDYLLPFAQLAQDQLVKEALENPNLGNLYQTIIVPDVPIGTRSLGSDHFKDGGDLELLSNVVSMKERAANGSRAEQDWMWMTPVVDVPTFNQGAFNTYFAWRGDDILLPGTDQTMDLRIFGKFIPKEFKNASSPVVPNTSVVLAFRVAGMVAGSRGNDSMFAKWESRATILSDGLMINAIMEMQNCRNRNRSFSGRGNAR